MEITQFLSNSTIAQFELNICRVARDCLFTDVDKPKTTKIEKVRAIPTEKLAKA
jgi:hypothetical protein